MISLDSLLCAFVGFFQGYIGFAAVFYLTAPLAKRLLRSERQELPITKALTYISTLFFLGISWLVLGGAFLELASASISPLRMRLAKAFALGMLVGMAIYVLIPAMESKIRKKAKEKGEGDH
jgi:hypothetical protein